MSKPGPKPPVNMADYIPPSRSWRLALDQKLQAHGTGKVRAAGILQALDALAETGSDGLNYASRSRYCRALAEIGPPPWAFRRSSIAEIGSTHSYP